MRNVFCNRKGGATIRGKFFALPPYSELKAAELERASKKRMLRLINGNKKIAKGI